jgi:hypothetical protein
MIGESQWQKNEQAVHISFSSHLTSAALFSESLHMESNQFVLHIRFRFISPQQLISALYHELSDITLYMKSNQFISQTDRQLAFKLTSQNHHDAVHTKLLQINLKMMSILFFPFISPHNLSLTMYHELTSRG